MGFNLHNKQLFSYTLLLVIIWVFLILKSVIAPIDIDFIQRLLSGIKANEPVKVVLLNISKNDQPNLRVYRINQEGRKVRVYRQALEYPMFENKNNYWFGINLRVPAEQLQSLKIEIYIGENKIDVEDVQLEITKTVDTNSYSHADISIQSIETNKSFIPFLRNVINYRGDRYLLLSTLFLALIFSVIAILLYKCVDFSFGSESQIMGVLIILCLLILKMLASPL